MTAAHLVKQNYVHGSGLKNYTTAVYLDFN